MTLQKLDYIFPFLVFFYGIMMTIVLETGIAQRVAKAKNLSFSEGAFAQMLGHRHLGLTCLIVGGLWSLQNLWF